MKRKTIAFSFVVFLNFFALQAGDAAFSAFIEGCAAYAQGDWISAILSLKKSASLDSNDNPETYYMLVNAQMNTGDYEGALTDCEWYLENFRRTLYEPNIMYFKGRCLYLLEEYDKAVIVLSDFCHQYEDHDLYASAIYWIGECFYSCYQYDDALSLFQRVVSEFPECAMASSALYKIETIGQREREEKLLYLLKQTGEEYLVAKEEYEKQLKIKSPDTVASTRQKLYDANERNRELEEKYEELARELEELKAEKEAAEKSEAEGARLIRELKQKAAQTKMLLDYMEESD